MSFYFLHCFLQPCKQQSNATCNLKCLQLQLPAIAAAYTFAGCWLCTHQEYGCCRSALSRGSGRTLPHPGAMAEAGTTGMTGVGVEEEVVVVDMAGTSA